MRGRLRGRKGIAAELDEYRKLTGGDPGAKPGHQQAQIDDGEGTVDLGQDALAKFPAPIASAISQELDNVLDFLWGEADLKVGRTKVGGVGGCPYFRAVNFHVAVLKHHETIMPMLPTYTHITSVKSLQTVKDSAQLGAYMLVCSRLDKL